MPQQDCTHDFLLILCDLVIHLCRRGRVVVDVFFIIVDRSDDLFDNQTAWIDVLLYLLSISVCVVAEINLSVASFRSRFC